MEAKNVLVQLLTIKAQAERLKLPGA